MHAALPASTVKARESSLPNKDTAVHSTFCSSARELPEALAKYESYVASGGHYGLSKWLQVNGHAYDSVPDVPNSVFAKAKYSRTPVQDLWNGKDAREREQIEALVRHFAQGPLAGGKQLSLHPDTTAALVHAKPAAAPESEIAVIEVQRVSEMQPKVARDANVIAGTCLAEALRSEASGLPVVFKRTAWFVPEDPAQMSREEARSLYEQCYFLSYVLGIAWHPDLDALIQPTTKPAGGALSLYTKGSGNRMHPVTLCAQMLEQNDDHRAVLATETLRAGGHYVGGWQSWLQSGTTKRAKHSARAKLANDFFGIYLAEEHEPVPDTACHGRMHDVHEIIQNKCKMSFQKYRECAPVFMGFIVSLPSMEYSRKMMPPPRKLSAREQQCIIEMALFYCWLVLEVPAVRNVARWETGEFRKALGDALARKPADVVKGMQEILVEAMRRSRVAPSTALEADAVQHVLIEKSRVVRMSYYAFAQRVCGAISSHFLATHAMACGREEHKDKISAAKEQAGDGWGAAIAAIGQRP